MGSGQEYTIQLKQTNKKRNNVCIFSDVLLKVGLQEQVYIDVSLISRWMCASMQLSQEE